MEEYVGKKSSHGSDDFLSISKYSLMQLFPSTGDLLFKYSISPGASKI